MFVCVCAHIFAPFIPDCGMLANRGEEFVDTVSAKHFIAFQVGANGATFNTYTYMYIIYQYVYIMRTYICMYVVNKILVACHRLRADGAIFLQPPFCVSPCPLWRHLYCVCSDTHQCCPVCQKL